MKEESKETTSSVKSFADSPSTHKHTVTFNLKELYSFLSDLLTCLMHFDIKAKDKLMQSRVSKSDFTQLLEE